MAKIRIFIFGLVVICCVLAFSAVIDLSLWFLTNYMIPSWTVSAFSFGFILFLLVFMHFLEKVKLKEKKVSVVED